MVMVVFVVMVVLVVITSYFYFDFMLDQIIFLNPGLFINVYFLDFVIAQVIKATYDLQNSGVNSQFIKATRYNPYSTDVFMPKIP